MKRIQHFDNPIRFGLAGESRQYGVKIPSQGPPDRDDILVITYPNPSRTVDSLAASGDVSRLPGTIQPHLPHTSMPKSEGNEGFRITPQPSSPKFDHSIAVGLVFLGSDRTEFKRPVLMHRAFLFVMLPAVKYVMRRHASVYVHVLMPISRDRDLSTDPIVILSDRLSRNLSLDWPPEARCLGCAPMHCLDPPQT